MTPKAFIQLFAPSVLVQVLAGLLWAAPIARIVSFCAAGLFDFRKVRGEQ